MGGAIRMDSTAFLCSIGLSALALVETRELRVDEYERGGRPFDLGNS